VSLPPSFPADELKELKKHERAGRRGKEKREGEPEDPPYFPSKKPSKEVEGVEEGGGREEEESGAYLFLSLHCARRRIEIIEGGGGKSACPVHSMCLLFD